MEEEGGASTELRKEEADADGLGKNNDSHGWVEYEGVACARWLGEEKVGEDIDSLRGAGRPGINGCVRRLEAESAVELGSGTLFRSMKSIENRTASLRDDIIRWFGADEVGDGNDWLEEEYGTPWIGLEGEWRCTS